MTHQPAGYVLSGISNQTRHSNGHQRGIGANLYLTNTRLKFTAGGADNRVIRGEFYGVTLQRDSTTSFRGPPGPPAAGGLAVAPAPGSSCAQTQVPPT
jgi:hypothetical protein